MADPVVTPGNQTSEYKVTVFVSILTILSTVVPYLVTIFTDLQAKFPAWTWIAPILTILGILGAVINALGYQSARTQVKVAALNASAAVENASPPADNKVAEPIQLTNAAANLGQP